MRLDKYISHSISLSRKDSRKSIKAGAVTVNANVVIDPGFQIQSSDTVELQQQPLSLPSHRYYMLHKPINVVSASVDADNPCVTDLIEDSRPGLQVAGRLDKDATGLILLSDDGDWIHQIISPNKHCVKTYRVDVDQPLSADAAQRFAAGIQLQNEKKPTRPAQLESVGGCCYRVKINEGRYHQIKRMFAACGTQVTTLHREQIGAIVLDSQLQPGAYRPLTSAEIDSVRTA